MELLEPLQGRRVKLDYRCLALMDSFVHEIKSMGYNIFLDLKLHDIPNTVAKAIFSLSSASIDLLTIHASGGSECVLLQLKQG